MPLPPHKKQKKTPKRIPKLPEKHAMNFSIWYAVGATLLLIILQTYLFAPETEDISYNEFKKKVKDGQVASCQIMPNLIRGEFKQTDKKSKAPLNFRTARVDDPDLVKDLLAANVKFSGYYENPWKTFLISWILPIAVLLLLWRVFNTFVRKSVERPLHRWVIVPEDNPDDFPGDAPEDVELEAGLQAGQREPVA